MVKKLSARFDQLEKELPIIEGTKQTSQSEWGISDHIDEELFSEWKVKAISLIVKTCGKDSEHYRAIKEAEKPHHFDSNYKLFRRIRPIFLAAKSDFQGGYLTSIKRLVQAELFDSELDQARELLRSGYKGPAAVVAGIVLETAIRDLCNQHEIANAKLDKMNSELAKAGVYTKLQQKKITALADIRNSAAHGDWQSFSDSEVSDMMRDVENFLTTHLA